MTALRFLPLRPRTNKAWLTDWPRRASSDPDQIQAWRHEFGGCNWGILTGNGLGVLDVDCKEEKDKEGNLVRPWDVRGFASVIDIEEMLDVDLSNLPMVQTASGAHLYFRYEGVLSSTVPWVRHLDVMADGGHQVAAPGTVRDVNGVEKVYTLLRGSLEDIPYAPDPLVQAIRGWHEPIRTGRGGSSQTVELPSTEYAIQHGLPVSERNKQMHGLACRWWSVHGLTAEATVYGLARQVWEATPDHDSFPWTEAARAVRSAYEFMAREADKNLAAIAVIMKNWGLS